jgi:hypothetical protein
MEHCRPKRPGDTTGAGRVWTDQGLARNGGDKSTCVLVAGQTVGSGNKGIAEAERCGSGRAGTMPTKHDNASRRVPSNSMLNLVSSWTRAHKEIE